MDDGIERSAVISPCGQYRYRLYREWAESLRLALAVQDGMTPAEVSSITPRPDVIFVGGSTEWKWATVADWAKYFPRVHVGRVNSGEKLDLCRSLKVESVDGTGWFRGKTEQIRQLGHFLRKQALDADWNDVDHVVAHSRLKALQQLNFRLEGT